jgi:hypothetical protein
LLDDETLTNAICRVIVEILDVQLSVIFGH